MGDEARCAARWNGTTASGRALLETDALIFRGAFRLVIPYAQMRSVRAADGVLTIRFPGGTASFELGERAERWTQRILHPKSRLDKIGLRAIDRVAAIGVSDKDFLRELRAAGPRIVRGRAGARLSHVFLQADDRTALRRVPAAAKMLAPHGALWLITPRGVAAVTEADALAAGRAAGLTDVKVIRFSATHTAHKFVIPRARRGPRSTR